jgi:hypothetical protein
MEAAMDDYRLYYLDGEGYISGLRVFSGIDETEAIIRFNRNASDRPMELWHLDRRIKTYLPPGGGSGAAAQE